MRLVRVYVSHGRVDVRMVIVQVEKVKVVVFRQESDDSEKELFGIGGSPQLLPERPGFCKQELEPQQSEIAIAFSLIRRLFLSFSRSAPSLPPPCSRT